jgi:fatty-acyl-CoA synthase
MSNNFQLSLQPDGSRLTWAFFLEDVVARFGNQTCIHFQNKNISYQQLAADSRALAKALANAGVVKGMRVAVHMANRPEFAVASFAVAQLGAVLVPINTFATSNEREYILRHGDASVLLFQSNLLKNDFLKDIFELIPEARKAAPGKLLCERTPNLRRIICLNTSVIPAQAGIEHSCVEDWNLFIDSGKNFPDAIITKMTAEVFPSDEGVMIYTSGTTSKPKGVLHRQRAAVIQSWRTGEYMRLTSADRVYTAYPFFWSAGMSMALGACLATGAVLVLEETFDPESALKTIAGEKCNVTQCWPHQSKAMIEHPLAKTLDLSQVTKEVCAMRAPQNPTDQTWDMSGSFGMTETFTFASNIPADSSWQKRQETAGKPLPAMLIKVVNPDTGETISREQMAQGEKGELCAKGATLMIGYYKVDPENVFDDEGYYHSADGGHIDAEGYVHWTGRMSNMIKTGGANVSPLEIEQTLADYPGLRAAVVFGAPHPSLGEVIVLCAAALKSTGSETSSLETSKIQAFLKDKLAVYKRPKLVLLFDESDLDFTGNQKIQTDKLKAKALKRMKDNAVEIDGVNYGEFLVS